MVELHSKQAKDIPVRELKDGQIGVITRWTEGHTNYLGGVIQRHKEGLVCIGMNSGESFPRIAQYDTCRVRILEDGETLVITNNQ